MEVYYCPSENVLVVAEPCSQMGWAKMYLTPSGPYQLVTYEFLERAFICLGEL